MISRPQTSVNEAGRLPSKEGIVIVYAQKWLSRIDWSVLRNIVPELNGKGDNIFHFFSNLFLLGYLIKKRALTFFVY